MLKKDIIDYINSSEALMSKQASVIEELNNKLTRATDNSLSKTASESFLQKLAEQLEDDSVYTPVSICNAVKEMDIGYLHKVGEDVCSTFGTIEDDNQYSITNLKPSEEVLYRRLGYI